jgi:hypothetical protein
VALRSPYGVPCEARADRVALRSPYGVPCEARADRVALINITT